MSKEENCLERFKTLGRKVISMKPQMPSTVQVGDIVSVDGIGLQYTTYHDFFMVHGLKYEWASRYANTVTISDAEIGGAEFKVLYIGVHEYNHNINIAVITPLSIGAGKPIYLIDVNGLSIVKKFDKVEM